MKGRETQARESRRQGQFWFHQSSYRKPGETNETKAKRSGASALNKETDDDMRMNTALSASSEGMVQNGVQFEGMPMKHERTSTNAVKGVTEKTSGRRAISATARREKLIEHCSLRGKQVPGGVVTQFGVSTWRVVIGNATRDSI